MWVRLRAGNRWHSQKEWKSSQTAKSRGYRRRPLDRSWGLRQRKAAEGQAHHGRRGKGAEGTNPRGSQPACSLTSCQRCPLVKSNPKLDGSFLGDASCRHQPFRAQSRVEKPKEGAWRDTQGSPAHDVPAIGWARDDSR